MRIEYDMKRTMKMAAVAFAAAVVLSAATAYLPMYFAVPRFLYANFIPSALMAVVCGPVSGAVYAFLISLILNNIGMGSGAMLNTLLIQAAEAICIGLVLHRQQWRKRKLRICVSVLGLAAFDAVALKILSYSLYFLFHIQSMREKKFLQYVAENFTFYLKSGLKPAFGTAIFSITAAYVIGNLIIGLTGFRTRKTA